MRQVRPLWRSFTDALVFLVVLVGVLLALEIFGTIDIVPGSIAVIDGDSLRDGQTEIRLYGIDAPEYLQSCLDAQGSSYSCGKRAADELRKLVRAGEIKCSSSGLDRYHRAISRCHSGALDVNQEMVRRGWAVAFIQFGSDYVYAETQARQAKRGLWAGSFEEPAQFRKRQHAVQGGAAGANDIDPD